MKNIDKWKPTKFEFNKRGKLVASNNFSYVGAGSRLMANLIAKHYQDAIKDYCKGRLIDLGCGNVPFYMAYKNYILENICVDWGNTAHSNLFLDYECDLTKKLPFKDNEFDTILISDVLEHIPNPDNLWLEMNRILKKGGILMLNVPFFYMLHERPYDFYRYSLFKIKSFCDEFNFEIIKLKPIGGSPEVLTDIFSKHLAKVPKIGAGIAILLQSITMFFINTKLGKKYQRKQALCIHTAIF